MYFSFLSFSILFYFFSPLSASMFIRHVAKGIFDDQTCARAWVLAGSTLADSPKLNAGDLEDGRDTKSPKHYKCMESIDAILEEDKKTNNVKVGYNCCS